MNLLRLSSLFLAPAVLASVALACGEITDPNASAERTATVSGALTGTSVPAGARVAVVWRNGNAGGVAVGSETAIVNGKFTMTLTVPPAAYFYPMSGNDYESLNDAPNATPPPAPVGTEEDTAGTDPGNASSGGGKVAQKLGTRDTISGGITEPLSVATAGFVVYVDANGNGKLDLEGEYACRRTRSSAATRS